MEDLPRRRGRGVEDGQWDRLWEQRRGTLERTEVTVEGGWIRDPNPRSRPLGTRDSSERTFTETPSPNPLSKVPTTEYPLT